MSEENEQQGTEEITTEQNHTLSQEDTDRLIEDTVAAIAPALDDLKVSFAIIYHSLFRLITRTAINSGIPDEEIIELARVMTAYQHDILNNLLFKNVIEPATTEE